METSNEELQATNEELVASNEELQSTNEELHSVNEELYTVNAEHQRKISELTQLTDDMDNLLRGTEVGTIFLDVDLRIRKFTPAIAGSFHILPQDIGRRIDSFSHTIHHDGLLDDVTRVLETDERIEKEVCDRSGKWYLLRILPYRSKSSVEGVVLTLIDVSLLKRAEKELRLMSKVFADAADPILIEDLSGRIMDLNREAEHAYGWTRVELLGADVYMLVPDALRAQAKRLRERCLQNDHVKNVECVRRDKSGREHPVLLTLSKLTDTEGKTVAIATIAKDISAQKKAEANAREAVRRRDHFLAMLSHELRNPLGAVLNGTYLLEKPDLDREAVRRAAKTVQRQGRQMARLLDDLLDVSRVTHGKIELRETVLDLNTLVSESIQAVQSLIDQKGHRLHVELEKEPLVVCGDRTRLLQIQQNLLANAAKYTPPGGRIRLTLKRENDQAVLRVRDNGAGIPPEMLQSIFELFVQTPRPLDRSDSGMGVGLTLVRTLVEIHGGHVLARSAGHGQGAEFEVRLPLTDRPIPEKTADASPGREASHVSIVIVEDNEDSRNMLRELLQLDGYEVFVAADGTSGLRVIEQQRPDVALIDIGLPGISGYEVAENVRRRLRDDKVQLVALTGYGRAEDRRAVQEAGFDGHLVKPLNLEDLNTVLRKPR